MEEKDAGYLKSMVQVSIKSSRVQFSLNPTLL